MKIIQHFLAFFLLFSALSVEAKLRENILFTAQMDGAQMMPTSASTAKGIGTVMLNMKRDSLSVSFSIVGMTPTFAAIFIGAEGENGTMLFDLSDGISGKTILKRLAGSDVKNNLKHLLTNRFYLVVGTAANPGGEIRGQIRLATDLHFVTDLKGAEQVPAVTTNAFGLGSFSLSMDREQVDFKVLVQQTSGTITSLKLHAGGFGVEGPELLDLSNFVTGKLAVGNFPATPAILTALFSGEMYLNLSTSAFPDGELRSQLRRQSGLTMETFSDGQQMVPPINSAAKSVGVYRFSPTMDTLFYDIVSDGIATGIDYMHLHVGLPGQAYGALQVDFTNAISGNRTKGFAKGTGLSTASITKILTGNLTLLTHTTAHPGGEIRGHLNRFAHEGHTVQLDGASGSGYGSGWVAINALQDHAYYSWLAGDLTSVPTAANFTWIQSSQSVHDMTDAMQISGTDAWASGVWKSTDSPAFSVTNAMLFDQSKIRLDISSANNPAGELSGQIKPGMVFYNSTVATDELFDGKTWDLSLSPNPTQALLNLQMQENVADKLRVSVVDVYGKTLRSTSFEQVSGAVNLDINVVDLASGVYFLVISDGQKTASRKFLKG